MRTSIRFGTGDENYDRERRLDRDFEREGGYPRRPKPQLISSGTLRARFAGVVQPPVKIGGGR